MIKNKTLIVLWSKAAADAANQDLSALHDKLVAEAEDIIPQARAQFLHVFAPNGKTGCFMGSGHELPYAWKLFVQLGEHMPLQPLPNDHPDPDLRGKVYMMPKAIEGDDNRLFAEISSTRD